MKAVLSLALFGALTAVSMAQPEPRSAPFEGKVTPVLTSPVRITADGQGRLLVGDYKTRHVYTIDPDTLESHSAFSVGGRVTAIGAVDDRVFVGNESTSHVDVFTSSGRRMGSLGGDGMLVADPTDLAIDPDANLLFLVDGGEKNVKVFNLTNPLGDLQRVIGAQGLEEWEFQHPSGITLDPIAREVFVSDYGEQEDGVDPRVLVFGYDGTYLSSISGHAGMLGYHFSKPQGLEYNDAGHIFVVDGWQGKVVVMDRYSGEKVTTLGEYGRDPGQLLLPLDVLIFGPDDDLYVTNNRQKRIELFPEGGRN